MKTNPTAGGTLARLCTELDAAGVFNRLPIEDGETLVAALSHAVELSPDPARSMRARAAAVRAGRWPAEDRIGVARALNTAAALMARRR